MLVSQITGTSGLKLVIRHMNNSAANEQTLYLQQDRKRMEYRNSVGGDRRRWDGSPDVRYGPRLASITRCDLGRSFELNLDAQEFVTAPYPPATLTKAQTEALGFIPPQFASSAKPTLRIETTPVDTGERKPFFGHTARHVITTRKQIPLEGSRSKAQETVTDGWYIDLDTRVSCDYKSPSGKTGHIFLAAANEPIEKMEFVDKGPQESGFAIESKITTKDTIADGTKQGRPFVSRMEVIELAEGPLDPELFAVPPGFRQVEHIERNPAPSLQDRWNLAWYRFKASLSGLLR